MIYFEEMLYNAAEEAGMKTPTKEGWDKEEYPHFHVFCFMQLGESMPYSGCHWDNAKVIADLTDEEIKTITVDGLLDRGFAVGDSSLYN